MRNRIFAAVVAVLMAMAAYGQETGWWGHWTTPNMPQTETLAVADGLHDFAVRLMPTDELLRDGRVHGVRFLISDKTAVKRAWIWVSARQFSWKNGEPDMAVKELSASELHDIYHAATDADAYTEAFFDEPVDILPSANARANCYVGYTLEIEGSYLNPCYPICSGPAEPHNAQSCIVDWKAADNSYGVLALQLSVSGANIGVNSAKPVSMETTITTADAQDNAYNMQASIENRGTAPLTDVDYVVSLNGVAQPERHVDFWPPQDALGRSVTFSPAIDYPGVAARYDCQLTITRVNGQPNENAQPSAHADIYVVSQMPLRRSVMEELTGTWCPNCPRGLVGMRVMEEWHPGRFIGIAVHGGDSTEPMRLPAYDGSSYVRGLSSRLGGRPSCSVDRTIECDPYMGIGHDYRMNIDFVVSNLLNVPTLADLDVTASWTDETCQAVAIDAATTFRYSDADASPSDYQLMLVLTADSLTGEGSDWLQVNTLVGKTEWDSYLDEFIYGTHYMALKYNHVPVWAEGVEQGIEGSIGVPFVADEAQHYRRTIALSDVPLASILTPLSLQHLHAVAMLIDTRTGQVANAAKAPVAAPTGMQPRHFSATTGSRLYRLDGTPAAPGRARGLLIQRQSDGSAKICHF